MRNPFRFITRFFARGRTAPPDPQGQSTSYLRPLVPGMLAVTNDDAMNISTIFACVSKIANAIANSDFRVLSIQGTDRVELPEDPAVDLLNWWPNDEMLPAQVKFWLVRDSICYGATYAELVRNGAGDVVEIWPLRADSIAMYRTPTGKIYYLYTQPDGSGQVVLEDRQVMRIPGAANSLLGLIGDSIVQRAGRAAALAKAQEEFSLYFYRNNASIGGFVRHPSKLTPKQLADYNAALVEQFGGLEKTGGWMVLDQNGEAVPLEAKLTDAQMVEARGMSIAQLASFFGVAPATVGDPASSQGYGSNFVAYKIDTYQDGVLPWAVRLSEALTKTLWGRKSRKVIEVDLRWWLDPGRIGLSAAQAQDVAARILSVDEARAERGLNSLPDGSGKHQPPAPRALPAGPAKPPFPPGGEPQQPREDTRTPPGGKVPQALALVVSALERHAARAKARRTDLEKAGKSAEEIAENLAGLRPRALADVQAVLELAELEAVVDLVAVLDRVERGARPAQAAATLAAWP